MISVCHVITGLDVGGAETALLRLVAHSNRQEFRTLVVALTGPGALVPQFEAAGVRVVCLNARRSNFGAVALALCQVVRGFRPNLLQTWLYHADLFGLMAARLCGVPVVGWNLRCAELAPADHTRSLFWIRCALARLSWLPDFVVANSAAARAAHHSIGYRPARWETIPNGFDTDVYTPSPESRLQVRGELGVGPHTPLVGMIARYHPMKDHGTFLASAALVRRQIPSVRFVLAGRKVDESNSELVTRIRSLGLAGQVTLLGEISPTHRLLAALDVAVSSSYSEGFPNVLGEAMAAGVPIVATDAGDSALIAGEIGTIVPIRHAEALAGGIAEILSLDPQEHARRGMLARQRIEAQFSIASVVRRYENLYTELVSERERVHVRHRRL